MMTLFTDAMSDLPSNQFTYSMLVPFTRHDFQARDALRAHDFSFAHAVHPRQRLVQPIEVHAGCDRKRQTRKLVDRIIDLPDWRSHAEATTSQTATRTAQTANTPVVP